MQFTKKYKYIFSFTLILLLTTVSYSQETDTLVNNNLDKEVVKTEKEGFFKKLFKKKNKNNSPSDSTKVSDTKSEDNLPDSVSRKGINLFSKNKNDSVSDASGTGKPQKISADTWRNMDAEQQDSLLRAWDEYDKEYFSKKRRYSFSRKEIEIALSSKRNFLEKIIYERSRNKPYNYKRKLINRKNGRIKKAMRLEDLNKDIPIPEDTITNKDRYILVRKQYRIEAKKEAVRKNKVVIKYERKEDRLRRRYELSGEEKKALNKGRGMRLRGVELITYKKGRRKQEAFTEKLIKLRRERNLALQNKQVKSRMKKKNKLLINKDKKNIFGDLFKRKKKDNKYDSDEYPKRYHK